ncbi:MAG TPA: SGNH/GDSL hydrolase family protein [Pseudolabrys sp.]|nr:SGNH/GDSL hydrolase family protein [Pseudolabrys sp.]
MSHISLAHRAIKGASAAVLFATLMLPLAAYAQTCDTPLDLVRLNNPLSHLAQKLYTGAPITIVAIGSSSTAGAGASSPAANYPSRLAVELRQRLPGRTITVINRGVNGEEVADMLKRFDQAVLAAKPDLVLWQLGTNSVIRDHPSGDHGAAIHRGIEMIRSIGADVVLIDPQFAPKVIAKHDAEHMVELIAATAKTENVDLFRRFDVMKRWRDDDHMAFESFVSPDGLHMNDWSYACMAKGLTIAIVDAAERPVLSAAVMSSFLP